MTHIYTPTPAPLRRRIRWRRIGLVLIFITAGIWLASLTRGSSFTVTRGLGAVGEHTVVRENPSLPPITEDPEYQFPTNEKGRLDVLLLGIRGEDDPENGGLLTDTIMLLSLDTQTGRASMTSIPRDLTVRLTDTVSGKINAAYIYNGLSGTKRLFSRILGVGIDHVVVVDFSAFQQIVDSLGGITITLDEPFVEPEQWGYEFSLPAGENHLNGEQTLYYVRSRYGTNDFDRARRQQQVLLALKDTISVSELATNPIKALDIITTVRKHVETDLDIFDIGTLKTLLDQSGDLAALRRYQLTTENFLYDVKVDGIYELLPRGDTLVHIQTFFQTVLDDKPVLYTPTPSSAPQS